MEENILYIIGAVAWFLFSAWQSSQKRKAKRAQEQQQDERYEETDTSVPQERENTPSFDEVLEELMGERQAKPEPAKPSPPPKRKPARPLKVVSKPEVRVEGGIPEDEFSPFKEFDRKQQAQSLGQELFEDQDATAKAFLASEIFRRKY